MQKLAKDIYVETGFTGVTVGAVVTPDGIICIDTPTLPSDARRWQKKLAELSPRPIQLIINLDHHRDRVLSNQWFDAPAIAHEITYERVRMLPELFKSGQTEAGADVELAAEPVNVRIVPPQITFSDRMTIVRGGREMHLVHRPGVTPGAIWVEFPKEQIVFVGDAVTNRVPPPMQDADLEGWLETLAVLRQARFPARYIVPGRGAPVKKDQIKTTETFLKTARRKIENLVRAKKMRIDAAAAADSLLEYYTVPAALREHYTRRLRAGLEHLYDELTTLPAR